ncbi:2-hydroxychromene-2-carboxylate isomerase [Luteimonas aestuarii]|uniref:2-hydroxychromene-2-carboxylate isomerase n=1 Tax=Luteimonas aestuarii TaxID=453837 RepID=A0A4V3AL99_9GAMM|nr:2-hydroxychromene-2-carboxylate isomerase [Luteimonas aestuarii]TDK20341.1 2-hydroxychromene-2-carboxylate isomerase [Luteimonas aestuarii]
MSAAAAAPARWYFDVVSPFAYLQWQRLRPLLGTHGIEPVPILFGAVLDALGQRGPAEIPRKREFTYRHVLWQARQRDVPLRFPPTHPFNPLAALRLCIAAGNAPHAIDAAFAWIWTEGRAGDSLEALAPLCERLGVDAALLSSDAVKATLRDNTRAAIEAQVFGVPTLQIGDTLFWGDDAHDFALAVLHDPSLLDDAEMQRTARLPVGVTRRREPSA